ncbi:hypothetical protein KSP39_PZI002008 [Platanthera zijinensis]|uniref:Uncharacterized protein n=1 Tax=Platanthera zijinensis TaxID=2320716 RepID=A0AAP0GE14_9ASPA
MPVNGSSSDFQSLHGIIVVKELEPILTKGNDQPKIACIQGNEAHCSIGVDLLLLKKRKKSIILFLSKGGTKWICVNESDENFAFKISCNNVVHTNNLRHPNPSRLASDQTTARRGDDNPILGQPLAAVPENAFAAALPENAFAAALPENAFAAALPENAFAAARNLLVTQCRAAENSASGLLGFRRLSSISVRHTRLSHTPIPATGRYEAPPAAGSRSIPPPLLEGRSTRQAFPGPPPVTTPAEEFSRLQPLLDSPFLNLKLYVSPNAVTPPEPHPSIPLPSAVPTLLFLEDLVPVSRGPVPAGYRPSSNRRFSAPPKPPAGYRPSQAAAGLAAASPRSPPAPLAISDPI